MPDVRFASLSSNERIEALRTALRSEPSGAEYLLEKDIWVVATIEALFGAPFAADLVFKGGTSLSKAWGAIRRFSEDVDVTYDIRAIAPDLVGDAGPEALPPTRSQEQRWTREVRKRLSSWVRNEGRAAVADGLARAGFDARADTSGDRILVKYEPLFRGYGFIKPTVVVEFGARSTGEPHQVRTIRCDAALLLQEISFPEARPSVMLAERTFWEKATAMHVFCKRERGRGERLTRHWYDLVRLDRTGFAEKALADRTPRFERRASQGHLLQGKGLRGELGFLRGRRVRASCNSCPPALAGKTLAEDYRSMVQAGMLPGDAESFDELMDACADLERRANDC